MSGVREQLHRAQDWVKSYIKRNPQASVHEIAKAANNSRVPISQELISDIKRSMNATSEPFNSPRLTVAPAPPTPPPPAPARATPPAVPPPQTPATSPEPEDESQFPREGKMSTEQVQARREHLNKLLEANPRLEPDEARKLVRDKFGLGLTPSYIRDTISVAREVAGLPPLPNRRPELRIPTSLVIGIPGPQLPPVEAPIPPTPTSAPTYVEDSGKRILSYLELDKRVYKEVPKESLSTELIKLLAAGVLQSSIRIYREVEMRINIAIDVG